jgi:drug/metabolite transporter (DMT)-like permease
VIYGIVAGRAGPSVWTVLGLAGILVGLSTIAATGPVTGASNVFLGDMFFLATGLLWGFYPILLQRWQVEPTVSAAVVSVLSMAYLPFYAATGASNLLQVPLGLVAFQAFYQGILNVVVGLWLWGHAVQTLGAARTQLFPPLLPVLGTLIAIPVLGEVPGPIQAVGLVLIVGGIVMSLLGTRRARGSRP